jgi:hypothetical protein
MRRAGVVLGLATFLIVLPAIPAAADCLSIPILHISSSTSPTPFAAKLELHAFQEQFGASHHGFERRTPVLDGIHIASLILPAAKFDGNFSGRRATEAARSAVPRLHRERPLGRENEVGETALVPEPATLVLLGTGLLTLGRVCRRTRRISQAQRLKTL